MEFRWRDDLNINLNMEDKTTFLEIMEGKYMNIVFRYGNVSVTEPEDNLGGAILNFTLYFLDEELAETMKGDVEFYNVTGDILKDIITSAARRELNEDTTTNNKESSS